MLALFVRRRSCLLFVFFLLYICNCKQFLSHLLVNEVFILNTSIYTPITSFAKNLFVSSSEARTELNLNSFLEVASKATALKILFHVWVEIHTKSCCCRRPQIWGLLYYCSNHQGGMVMIQGDLYKV